MRFSIQLLEHPTHSFISLLHSCSNMSGNILGTGSKNGDYRQSLSFGSLYSSRKKTKNRQNQAHLLVYQRVVDAM